MNVCVRARIWVCVCVCHRGDDNFFIQLAQLVFNRYGDYIKYLI